jgi:hypothetical protein
MAGEKGAGRFRFSTGIFGGKNGGWENFFEKLDFLC